ASMQTQETTVATWPITAALSSAPADRTQLRLARRHSPPRRTLRASRLRPGHHRTSWRHDDQRETYGDPIGPGRPHMTTRWRCRDGQPSSAAVQPAALLNTSAYFPPLTFSIVLRVNGDQSSMLTWCSRSSWNDGALLSD